MLLDCENCKAKVDVIEIGSYENKPKESIINNGREVIYSTIFTLSKCPFCLNPILLSRTIEKDFYEDTILSEINTELLYPSEKNLIYSNLPIAIKTAFKDALSCYKVGLFTPCVIMCRKTIEGICKHHNVKGNNLKDKLLKLKKNEIIDNNLFDWADALRDFANEATHEFDVNFSAEDAEHSIEFTNALLNYTFMYKDKFTAFMDRKNLKVLTNEHSNLGSE